MIVDPLTLLAFIPAALALNLTPGPDMMFCLGQGLRGGPKAAIAADFGISTGAMIHVLVAGLGLGAIVASSPWVFDLIRWIGVGYLLWLAFGTLRNQNQTLEGSIAPSSHAFKEALIINLTNPKVILFVLAFVPQFVDPDRGQILAQFLIFGVILSIGGLIVNGVVGVLAGQLGVKFMRSSRFSKVLSYTTATIFAAIAIRLAIAERS